MEETFLTKKGNIIKVFGFIFLLFLISSNITSSFHNSFLKMQNQDTPFKSKNGTSMYHYSLVDTILINYQITTANSHICLSENDDYYYIAYVGSDGSDNEIFLINNSQGTWSAPINLTKNGVSELFLSMGRLMVEDNGDLLISYVDSIDGDREAYLINNTGGTWGNPVQLTFDTLNNEAGFINRNSSGNLFFIHDYMAGVGQPFKAYKREFSGGLWSPSTWQFDGTVDSTQGLYIMDFEVNQDDKMIVSYGGRWNNMSSRDVFYRTYSDGQWTNEIRATFSETDEFFHETVLDSNDNVIIARMVSDGDYDIYLTDNSGGTWATPFYVTENAVDDWIIDMYESSDGILRVFFVNSSGLFLSNIIYDVIETPEFESLFTWSTSFSINGIENELTLSILPYTDTNDALLKAWQIVPDEGYNFTLGVLFELTNISATFESLGVPQFIQDFVDFFMSEDGSLRCFSSLNILSSLDKDPQDLILDLNDVVEPLLKLILNPKNPISIATSYRWLIEAPIVAQYFDIVRGTNQYQLKIKPSQLENPILSILQMFDVFLRVDFYLLNMKVNETIPIQISLHDLIESAQIFLDIVKLGTKAGRILATSGADIFAWAQAGATAYKLIYKFFFDPPRPVESILNLVFPGQLAHIQSVFDEYEDVLKWMYVSASFLDPPTSRLDLSVFDENGTVLLGFDSETNITTETSPIGFVVGDPHGQFMFLNFSAYSSMNLSILNTDLDESVGFPLNYSVILKEINSNNTWMSEGQLLDGDITSTNITYINATFQLSILKCILIENVHPKLIFQILDGQNKPLELDCFTLYCNNQLINGSISYLGNGTYIIENIPISYNAENTYLLVIQKDHYLMSMVTFKLLPPHGSSSLIIIILVISIFGIVGICLFIFLKRRKPIPST